MIYALIALSQLLDFWTTKRVLEMGGAEANPIVNYIIHNLGFGAFLALKLLTIAVLASMVPELPKVVWGILIFYGIVLVNNFLVLFSMR
jgi:hypothetical protein